MRDGACNLFGMRCHPNPALCPIKGIETRELVKLVMIARELGISLSPRYLFCATNHQGHIVDKPLLRSVPDSCLRKYLRDANIGGGETLHSFRSGCALTLAFSGSPLTDIMSHVGWSNSKTPLYYLKLADVIRAGAPADLLTSAPSQSQEAFRIYEDHNGLKDFVSAFPLSYSSSLKHALPP